MHLRRSSTATALAAIAAIHIALAPDHLREAPYAGVLFIALSAASLVVATLVLAGGGRFAWTAGRILAAGAMAGYVASRSVGLPSLGDDIGDWLNPLGVAALACELSVGLLCSNTVVNRWRSSRPAASLEF